MTCHNQRVSVDHAQWDRRTGFTLVELLVAIGVLSVLATMVMAAMNSAKSDALRVRAQSQIDRLNSIISELYAIESRRRFTLPDPEVGHSYNIPNYRNLPANQKVNETLRVQRQMNRTRLKLTRDWLRVSLPDRIADLSSDPRVFQLDQFPQSGGSPSKRSVTRRAAQERVNRFRLRVQATISTNKNTGTLLSWAAASSEWTTQHQDAECLYLILKSSSIGGSSAIEGLRSDQIGDTDEDGVPEILDPWGQPVGFMRWPVGYWLTYPHRMETNTTGSGETRADLLSEQKFLLGVDGVDLLRADYRFFQAAGSRDKQADDPYNVSPIVFSSGPDGVFDMVTRWRSDTGGTPSQLSYGTMPLGSEIYPDPYQGNYFSVTALNGVNYEATPNQEYTGNDTANTPFDQAFRNGLVGAYLDENGDQIDNSVDNLFPRS